LTQARRDAVFQPQEGCWDDYARRDGLRSVLDPADSTGVKNEGIDAVHKLALDRALRRRRFARVLDFGCGTGRLSRHLAPRAGRIVAADLTLAMLHRAARENSAPNLDYLRFDGHRLPMRDAVVDLVVSCYVLQYAVRERSAYVSLLGELARVLAPGGLLVCIEQASAGTRGSSSVGHAACIADYLEPGDRHFRQAWSEPIRLGRPGRAERRSLLRPGLPPMLRRAAARMALARVKHLGEEALVAQPYVDWLLCLTRREDVR
jgi:SAM-dependent methyltransferase